MTSFQFEPGLPVVEVTLHHRMPAGRGVAIITPFPEIHPVPVGVTGGTIVEPDPLVPDGEGRLIRATRFAGSRVALRTIDVPMSAGERVGGSIVIEKRGRAPLVHSVAGVAGRIELGKVYVDVTRPAGRIEAQESSIGFDIRVAFLPLTSGPGTDVALPAAETGMPADKDVSGLRVVEGIHSIFPVDELESSPIVLRVTISASPIRLGQFDPPVIAFTLPVLDKDLTVTAHTVGFG